MSARANAEGELSHVYPSLAAIDPDRFGICVANTRGLTADAGDADVEFTIMSVAKPLCFRADVWRPPPSTVAQFVGLNATGRRFNSVSAIEDRTDGKTNPMVNPGAMATTSMASGGNIEEKWRFLQEGCQALRAVNCRSMRRLSHQPRRRMQLIAPSVTFCAATAGSRPVRRRRSTCTRGKVA